MDNDTKIEIRKMIEDWAAAVSSGDREGILVHHSSDLLMFDFPDTKKGIDAYDKQWDFFYVDPKGPISFVPHDIDVIAGDDVAFATCLIHCDGTSAGPLDLRLTTGLQSETANGSSFTSTIRSRLSKSGSCHRTNGFEREENSMTKPEIEMPDVVDASTWLAARKTVQSDEERHNDERDALIAKRRNLPMVELDGSFSYEGPDGKTTLIDLFDGKRQLLVYHFWFEPGEEPCTGCSMWTRDLGDLGGNFAHLHKYDTAIAYVSRASAVEIEAVKKRRNWTMPWYSLSNDDFPNATGYDGWAQISVLVRKGRTAYLANVVPMGDLATLGNHWTLLDRTPLAREYR